MGLSNVLLFHQQPVKDLLIMLVKELVRGPLASEWSRLKIKGAFFLDYYRMLAFISKAVAFCADAKGLFSFAKAKPESENVIITDC